MDKIKRKILSECFVFLDDKTRVLEEIINSNKIALQSENKSSAGDKHETGRAMLQLEMEKVSTQFEGLNQMRTTLNRTDISEKSEIVRLGSLVKSSAGYYFLSISAGKVKVENFEVYCISIVSPIGKLLLGAKKGFNFYFNENKILIEDIY